MDTASTVVPGTTPSIINAMPATLAARPVPIAITAWHVLQGITGK